MRTNLGEGHVYELISDADGGVCRTLQDFCRDEELLRENFEMLVSKLKKLKQDMLREEIITMGLFSENILFQKKSDGEYAVRIVNDMGSAALLPLEYYLGFVARIRIAKRWQRFTQHLQKDFPSSELASKLAHAIK